MPLLPFLNVWIWQAGPHLQHLVHVGSYDPFDPAEAGKAGLVPDAWTCGNDAGTNGRPSPWMSVELAQKLNVYPLWECVKVDDTAVGIAGERPMSCCRGAWALSAR